MKKLATICDVEIITTVLEYDIRVKFRHSEGGDGPLPLAKYWEKPADTWSAGFPSRQAGVAKNTGVFSWLVRHTPDPNLRGV